MQDLQFYAQQRLNHEEDLWSKAWKGSSAQKGGDTKDPIILLVLRLAAQTRPQEAAFVLSLLSPDPEGRPSVDAIVRSELLLALHRSIRTRKPVPAAPSACAGMLHPAVHRPCSTRVHLFRKDLAFEVG